MDGESSRQIRENLLAKLEARTANEPCPSDQAVPQGTRAMPCVSLQQSHLFNPNRTGWQLPKSHKGEHKAMTHLKQTVAHLIGLKRNEPTRKASSIGIWATFSRKRKRRVDTMSGCLTVSRIKVLVETLTAMLTVVTAAVSLLLALIAASIFRDLLALVAAPTFQDLTRCSDRGG